MNRDGVEFVLEESQQSKKPPEPVSAEEAAKRAYVEKQWERREKMPGQSAPELDVAQWLRGEPVTLAELKGKVVLLHFWSDRDMVGMDAVRHRNTLRLVNTLQNVYGEDGLVCIGIYESTAKIDELEKLLAEKRVEYRTAVDRELSIAEARGATFDKYAVFSSLSFILIDANGVINSQPSHYKLEEKIRELISD
jgi:peroxiredoxin